MAVGFPASAQQAYRFDVPYDQLRNAAAGALQGLGWKFSEDPAYQFNASIKLSFWSWGEKVTVNVFQDGTVNMLSAGVMPLQWIDWGKNQKNIDKFFAQLNQNLGLTAPPQAAAQPPQP